MKQRESREKKNANEPRTNHEKRSREPVAGNPAFFMPLSKKRPPVFFQAEEKVLCFLADSIRDPQPEVKILC